MRQMVFDRNEAYASRVDSELIKQLQRGRGGAPNMSVTVNYRPHSASRRVPMAHSVVPARPVGETDFDVRVGDDIDLLRRDAGVVEAELDGIDRLAALRVFHAYEAFLLGSCDQLAVDKQRRRVVVERCPGNAQYFHGLKIRTCLS